MQPKTKARDIISGWPRSRSTSHPPIMSWTTTSEKFAICSMQRSTEGMEGFRYHARQAGELEGFMMNAGKMRELLISIQRQTGRRLTVIAMDSDCWLEKEYPAIGFRAFRVGYPTGEVIQAGLCGMNAKTPAGCMFCPFGHMMECHFPRTCAETLRDGNQDCSHAMNDFVNEEIGGRIQ